MGFTLDDYAAGSIVEQRIQKYIREAEIDHLLSAGPPRESGWWPRVRAAPLRWLGHALTRMGERLASLDMLNPEISREQETLPAAATNE
jgi:hypothetical protein